MPLAAILALVIFVLSLALTFAGTAYLDERQRRIKAEARATSADKAAQIMAEALAEAKRAQSAAEHRWAQTEVDLDKACRINVGSLVGLSSEQIAVTLRRKAVG